FGAARKGAKIVEDIETVFSMAGVVTVPALNETPIDDLVRFELSSALPTIISENNLDSPHASTPPMEEPIPTESVLSNEVNNGTPVGLVASSGDQLEPESDEEHPTSKPDDHPVTSEIR